MLLTKIIYLTHTNIHTYIIWKWLTSYIDAVYEGDSPFSPFHAAVGRERMYVTLKFLCLLAKASRVDFKRLPYIYHTYTLRYPSPTRKYILPYNGPSTYMSFSVRLANNRETAALSAELLKTSLITYNRSSNGTAQQTLYQSTPQIHAYIDY